MSTGMIRHAAAGDLDQMLAIYVACFPERVAAVFGRRAHPAFVRDYLAFYLSWDPAGNWVYAEGGTVLGFLIAPARYTPWRAALSGGQALRWLGHFALGRYGLPWRIARSFLRFGFSFRSDAALRRLWGRPYLHAIAVDPARGRHRAGIGAALIRHLLAEHERRGIAYCWGVVPSWNAPVVEFHRRLGARVEAVLGNGDRIIAYEIPAAGGPARPAAADVAPARRQPV
jgi:ribosomal protein S18 acetylase RimI-like enzyme